MKRSLYNVLLLLCFVSISACAPSEEPASSAPEEMASSANHNVDGKADWFFSDDVSYADMLNVTSSTDKLPVRGRLVEEDEEDVGSLTVTPFSQLSQDEIKEEEVEVRLTLDRQSVVIATLETTDEGWLDEVLDIGALELKPGRYEVEFWHDGEFAGVSQALLLDSARTAPVVRSDVDKTYLVSEFETTSGKLELLTMDAFERVALDGMEVVYQSLRGENIHPVTYLSGSPRPFKRTLENKVFLDGMEQDGLILKPAKDIIATNIENLSVDQIIPELTEQVGYKLYWLMKLRNEIPASAPEVLLGDDSEADFVVYAMYWNYLSKTWSLSELERQLMQLDVADTWRDGIVEEAKRLSAADVAAPVAIYINQTNHSSESFDIADWKLPSLTRHHNGSWPLMLDLFEEGLVTAEQVSDLKARMLELDYTEQSLRDMTQDADFLDAETIERFGGSAR